MPCTAPPPEIGLDLPRTQEKVLKGLDGLGLEVSVGQSCSSVTAVLRGTAPTTGSRGVVLLRGDMDALPVQERTGLPFASAVDGVMHASGHDLHTSMLLGSARLLADRRDWLAGDVVFMFQPGEEGYDGASKMIDEGVLDAAGRRADAAYAIHVMSSLQSGGTVFTKPGPAMSASDYLYVTVRGPGGHGSAPHLSPDPVPAAAEVISALQTLVARKMNIFDPVVVSIGVMHAGTIPNIILDQARFEASIRTFSSSARARLQAEIPRLLEFIAHGHSLDVDVGLAPGYPSTINDPAEAAMVQNSVSELLGPDRFHLLADPLTASEDFSRVLDEVPGAMTFLSAVPKGADHEKAAFNHSPFAIFDDDVLSDGAALYARLALDRLSPCITSPL